MVGSGVCGVDGGVGKIVCERMRCDTGCSGVDWFPIDILGGRAGGAASLSPLVVMAGLFTGDGGDPGWVGHGASTLGAAGGFSFEAGWVWCGG